MHKSDEEKQKMLGRYELPTRGGCTVSLLREGLVESGKRSAAVLYTPKKVFDQ